GRRRLNDSFGPAGRSLLFVGRWRYCLTPKLSEPSLDDRRDKPCELTPEPDWEAFVRCRVYRSSSPATFSTWEATRTDRHRRRRPAGSPAVNTVACAIG